jgi:hypothetical protein
LKQLIAVLALGTAVWATDTSCPATNLADASAGCQAVDTNFSNFAAIVVGGTLLTQAYANEIAGWIGQPNAIFTNILSEAYSASSPTDFHAAADGKGATIVILKVTPQGSSAPVLIGGYDPVSWNSLGAYITDPTDLGRTAFIYNLSTSVLQRQNLTSQGSSGDGQYQTFDGSGYGPLFGLGEDIDAFFGTNTSGAYADSYGGVPSGGTNILGNTGITSFTVDSIEVYTEQLPEPATFPLCVAGLSAAAWLRRRQRVSRMGGHRRSKIT